MRGTEKARALRRSQTDAEATLWRWLRDRRLHNFKFRRQAPVGSFIVDFVCLEARLIVELDGGQHVDHAKYDEQRTRFLQSLGFDVVRYWNDDVLLRTENVLEHLLSRLESPHPGPLPAGGEREHRPRARRP